ncbi:hypothetical protein [Myxacorys almedinensis]|uniref:hypothetical protein n=1 Tax=Myxacorys almedinensis TaxID=2651157 RepID=UPI00192E98DE
MVTLHLKQIDVPPGQRVLFHNVSWQEYEAILEELGENRTCRLAYSQGSLEIMSPLPEHEIAKVLIGDFIKMLLDEFMLPKLMISKSVPFQVRQWFRPSRLKTSNSCGV